MWIAKNIGFKNIGCILMLLVSKISLPSLGKLDVKQLHIYSLQNTKKYCATNKHFFRTFIAFS